MAVILIGALTALLLLVTAVPFLPISHGLVRVCDFPRQQVAILAALLVPFTLWALPFDSWGLALIVAQVAIVLVQTVQCARFTPLWRVQSLAYDGAPDDPSVVRIVSSNVKMSNRDYGRIAATIRERDPHIAILMEVDQAWIDGMACLAERLPIVVASPQENAYGMALYSRLELVDAEVRFLLLENVPSIRATVVLPDGRRFRLYALHPEPPVPNEDTLGRDGEIIMVAREVAEDPLPCVVTGDLNDVAWSRTTRRFQRLAGLLDPRVGRGFFNSFDARYPFLRWPLDHLFHDPEFRLVGMERLPYVGSDHFPMMFDLALTDEPAAAATPDAPDADDRQEARDVLREASELDRDPIGVDWEK